MVMKELSEDYRILFELGNKKSIEQYISMYFMELITLDSSDTFMEYLSIISNNELLLEIYLEYIMAMKCSLTLDCDFKTDNNVYKSSVAQNTSSLALFNVLMGKLRTKHNGAKYVNVLDVISKITCKIIRDIDKENIEFLDLISSTNLQVYRVASSSIEYKDLDGNFLSPKSYMDYKRTGNTESNEQEGYFENMFSLYNRYSDLIISLFNSDLYSRVEKSFGLYYFVHNMVMILLLSYTESIVNIINKCPLVSIVNENKDFDNNLQTK